MARKHHFAIIPVPAPEGLDAHKLASRHIGELLELYKEYDVTDGPMKAIITADEPYIHALTSEMELLLQDPELFMIK